MMGRIDIHVGVPRVEYENLATRTLGEESDVIRALVRAEPEQMGHNTGAYHCVLKLTRTIADLAGVEGIRATLLAEALHYRRRRLE